MNRNMTLAQAADLVAARVKVADHTKQADIGKMIQDAIASGGGKLQEILANPTDPMNAALIGGGLGVGAGALGSLTSSDKEKRKRWLQNALFGGAVGGLGGYGASQIFSQGSELVKPTKEQIDAAKQRQPSTGPEKMQGMADSLQRLLGDSGKAVSEAASSAQDKAAPYVNSVMDKLREVAINSGAMERPKLPGAARAMPAAASSLGLMGIGGGPAAAMSGLLAQQGGPTPKPATKGVGVAPEALAQLGMLGIGAGPAAAAASQLGAGNQANYPSIPKAPSVADRATKLIEQAGQQIPQLAEDYRGVLPALGAAAGAYRGLGADQRALMRAMPDAVTHPNFKNTLRTVNDSLSAGGHSPVTAQQIQNWAGLNVKPQVTQPTPQAHTRSGTPQFPGAGVPGASMAAPKISLPPRTIPKLTRPQQTAVASGVRQMKDFKTPTRAGWAGRFIPAILGAAGGAVGAGSLDPGQPSQNELRSQQGLPALGK